MQKQVACVAIIGPDDNPILIRKYCHESQEMELDALLFCALDYFVPQAKAKERGKDKDRKNDDRFLGNINTSDRYQTWGYKAALRYKIIVVTVHLNSVQDGPIKQLCERLSDALFDAIMDPFYQPFVMIEAPNVLAKVDNLARNLGC